ncbi:MAG: DUF4340 domain-containing protein [Saprospiraceae bacterium]|nr:DUF4340 domain-containing protein [Saprospiraceae bacterium]MBP7679902.1 DUF4340 domain-containing protein [Saprospiraceae bacterium]
MNRNNLILLIVLLVLAGIGIWFWQKQSKTSSASWDREFAIKDTKSIHKIFIASRSGESNTIEKKGNQWMLNGKYVAYTPSVNLLIQTMGALRLQYIPSNNAVKNIVNDLATNGLKVEVYDQSNRLLKTYYVGGSPNDEIGTYMIMDKAQQPYVMTLPAFEGNLRERFDLSRDDWRDPIIFVEKADNIRFVSINYPTERTKSFQLSREGEDFSITPYYNSVQPIRKPIKRQAVETFLDSFGKIKGDGFSNVFYARDSVSAVQPFCIATVVTQQDDTLRANFIVRGRERMIDSYWVTTQQGDLLTAQQQVISKIFWAYDAFFEK